tara:strand:+ start:10717 stop:11118 length:402 start_codon:yes stop_codon:yes gene_type:complete
MNIIDLEDVQRYEREILLALDEHANMFKLIGSSGKWGGVNETPRYYNIHDLEDNMLQFRSTQKHGLGFSIPLKGDDIRDDNELLDYSDIWEWFKKLRTNFLIDYHPTIDAGYPYFEDFDYSLRLKKSGAIRLF